MTSKQRENLERMGGRISTVAEFLGLSAHEEWLIEVKIDLGEAIRESRTARGWTPVQLAETLGISPQKTEALENGGPAISVELQLMALRSLEITRVQLHALLEAQFGSEASERESELAAA